VKRLLQAEWLKIRTTRTIVWYLIGLVVVVGIAVAGQVASAPRNVLESEQGLRDTLAAATAATFFALLFGLIGVAGEYRHGTITPTFLATPLRERVLIAKLIAHAGVGLLLGALALLVTLAMAVPWLAAKNVEANFADQDIVLLIVGALAASALWGALGVAFASVVPNQVAANVITLIWLLLVENIVGGLLPGVAPFTLGAAARGLMRIDDGDDLLTMWAAAAVTFAYIAALAGIGATVVMRRDVT
jgi:hypothetical protein